MPRVHPQTGIASCANIALLAAISGYARWICLRPFRAGLLVVVAVWVSPISPTQAATIFSDSFSGDTGWTLTNTWEIGSTATSPLATFHPDPSPDHTPTPDKRVLGTALGGNVGLPDGLHDFWWATSPLIDASAASTVYLSYWRWLNSDYDPFMTSRVEGWDGDSWEVIWTTAGAGTNPVDNQWTFQTFDVSSLAANNANFQVRFGYDVTNLGVLTVSGWNVDDVVVSDSPAIPEPAALTLWSGLGIMAVLSMWRRKLERRFNGTR